MNGQAAMAASGVYGRPQVAAGIVGAADLRLGARVREVLEAHVAAAPHRVKRVRYEALWDEDPSIVRGLFDNGPHLYADESFRAGLAELTALDLVFDAFVLAPQLPDVSELARACPETRIVLNHLGNPVGVGRHAGRMDAEYPAWRRDIAEIADC